LANLFGQIVPPVIWYSPSTVASYVNQPGNGLVH